jgi:hypothetical protein
MVDCNYEVDAVEGYNAEMMSIRSTTRIWRRQLKDLLLDSILNLRTPRKLIPHNNRLLVSLRVKGSVFLPILRCHLLD